LYQSQTQKISDTAFIAKIKTQSDEMKIENMKLKMNEQQLQKAKDELFQIK
jgi:hypothetical protein